MDKSEYLKQFGRRVHYYRELNGMTLQELSDKSGYTSRSTVAKLEKGQVDAPQSKVKAIAEDSVFMPCRGLSWTFSLIYGRFSAFCLSASGLSWTKSSPHIVPTKKSPDRSRGENATKEQEGTMNMKKGRRRCVAFYTLEIN